MKIGTPKEIYEGEARVGMTPDSALALQKLGYECVIESGAGKAAGFTDDAYRAAGVTVAESADALYSQSDVIAKVRPPENGEVARLSADKTLISFFYPAQNKDLLEQAKASGANVIAMDMVPRISRAQKMDALSSMANIAGYRAVIEAGNNFGRFFTGQVTAAGKVPRPRSWSLAQVSLASQPSVRQHRLAQSPMLSTCARKWPSRSSPWAPSSSISISPNSRMVQLLAVTPLPPRPSSAKSS